MNIVLYTRDMEPITVIDLPLWALEHGERLGLVRIPVNTSMVEVIKSPDGYPDPMPLRGAATLEFHRIRLLGGKSSWLVTVDDEVLALKLRPAWLPGQRGKINEYERTARDLSRVLLDVLARGVGGH